MSLKSVSITACGAAAFFLTGCANKDDGFGNWSKVKFHTDGSNEYQIYNDPADQKIPDTDVTYTHYWAPDTDAGSCKGCDASTNTTSANATSANATSAKGAFMKYTSEHWVNVDKTKEFEEILGKATKANVTATKAYVAEIVKGHKFANSWATAQMMNMTIHNKTEEVIVAIGEKIPGTDCGKCVLLRNPDNNRFMVTYPVADHGAVDVVQMSMAAQIYFQGYWCNNSIGNCVDEYQYTYVDCAALNKDVKDPTKPADGKNSTKLLI